MGDQAENVYMAKLAEQAERYDEMVTFMKNATTAATDDLSLEERNLLSVAYKNVVGARRASLRIIGSIETKERERNGANLQQVVNYKAKVETELDQICADILEARPAARCFASAARRRITAARALRRSCSTSTSLATPRGRRPACSTSR